MDELIGHLENQIQASCKSLKAALPKEDAAPVDPNPIYLPSPPEYKPGDKVVSLQTLFISNKDHAFCVLLFNFLFYFIFFPLKAFSLPVCVQISTRKAYGVALKKMGDASQRVVALDGDTKNSTFSETFKKAHPDRYIECFIAEQNMVRFLLNLCSIPQALVAISLSI